jgi:hypothetical protein
MNVLRCLIIFLIAAASLAGSTRADPIDDILSRFSVDKYPETERAIN